MAMNDGILLREERPVRREEPERETADERFYRTLHEQNYQINRPPDVSPYDNRIENLEPISNYTRTITTNSITINPSQIDPIEENNFMSFSEWGHLGQDNNISDVHSCLLRFLFFDYYVSFTKKVLKGRKDVNEMFRIFQKLNYSMDSMIECVKYGVLNGCSLSDAKANLFPDKLFIENNHKRHVVLPKDRRNHKYLKEHLV